MEAPLTKNPLSPGLLFFCGLVVAGAALREVGAHIVKAPLAFAVRRPSLAGTLVAAVFVKEAVDQMASSALGRPTDR
jgi:hypothetical protein